MTLPPFRVADLSADPAADESFPNGIDWHIVETGDRWHQALLSLARPGENRFATVSRWTPETATDLVARLAPIRQRQTVVIWELPMRPATGLEILEAIAAVSQHSWRIVQAAFPSAGSHPEVVLAAQELGIVILLHDLWSLRTIGYRLGQTGPTASN